MNFSSSGENNILRMNTANESNIVIITSYLIVIYKCEILTTLVEDIVNTMQENNHVINIFTIEDMENISQYIFQILTAYYIINKQNFEVSSESLSPGCYSVDRGNYSAFVKYGSPPTYKIKLCGWSIMTIEDNKL